jgi:ElaB/YqjD/DUF883 family membrane-anchored ribosome-binding protein
MAMKKRPLPPRPNWGDDTSPHCQIDGMDRRTPFSLEGVPTISEQLDRIFKTKAKQNHNTWETLRRQIQKATAELRRRYEEYGQEALRAMLAKERELEELTSE